VPRLTGELNDAREGVFARHYSSWPTGSRECTAIDERTPPARGQFFRFAKVP
jgi:hypothetical protein